jgi:hypothetical protein
MCLRSNLGALGDLEIGRIWYLQQRHPTSARTMFALFINRYRKYVHRARYGIHARVLFLRVLSIYE